MAGKERQQQPTKHYRLHAAVQAADADVLMCIARICSSAYAPEDPHHDNQRQEAYDGNAQSYAEKIPRGIAARTHHEHVDRVGERGQESGRTRHRYRNTNRGWIDANVNGSTDCDGAYNEGSHLASHDLRQKDA